MGRDGAALGAEDLIAAERDMGSHSPRREMESLITSWGFLKQSSRFRLFIFAVKCSQHFICTL